MLTEVFACMLTVVLMMAAILCSPRRVECPPGWWLPEGARGGVARCHRKPTGDAVPNKRGFLVDIGIDPPGEIAIPLGCALLDIRQDGASAWCVP